MDESTTVYVGPVQVAGRLDELGVGEDVLRDAVLYGVQFVSECTTHDPPSVRGMLAWGKMTRGLRDRLVPLGWRICNSQNYATTIHPTRKYAIALCAGDSSIGIEENTPSTRTEKGPATRAAVRQNLQMSFADVVPSFLRTDEAAGVHTWLLLHYSDESAEEIRIELSLPQGMDEEGFVTRWRERIILRTAPFGTPHIGAIDRDGSDADDEEIDVPVEKRVS